MEDQTYKLHFNGFEGLRAIAILAIMAYHLFPGAVKGGYLGVCLFLVISGFLLMVTATQAGSFSYKEFYLKRLKRIYPALLTTVFVFLILFLIIDQAALKSLPGEFFSIIFGYNNIWQVLMNGSYFNRMALQSPFTHLWYLSMELQYYLIWPLLLMIFIRIAAKRPSRNASWLFMILAVLSALEMAVLYQPLSDPSRIYYGTDTRALSLLLGLFYGGLYIYGSEERIETDEDTQQRYGLIFGILAILLFLFILLLNGQSAFLYRGGMLLISAMFLVQLVCVIRSQDYLGLILDNKILSFIGKISYELYLVHYPIMYCFRNLFPQMQGFLLLILTFAISFVAAYLLHLWCSFLMTSDRVRALLKHKVYRTRVLAVLLIAAIAIVSYGSYVSANYRRQQAQLQQELEENQRMLEQQASADATAASGNATASGDSSRTSTGSVSMIGDSVMLGAAATLRASIPGAIINAQESRQASDILDLIHQMGDSNILGDTVVIELGTNGTIDIDIAREMLDYLGKGRIIYWITPYCPNLSWQQDCLETISTLADEYENVQIIDWYQYVMDNLGSPWFYADGIHLNEEGQQVYADLIASRLGYLQEDEEEESADDDTRNTEPTINNTGVEAPAATEAF